VHHACNEACLDTNYGSTLIIFDRLFGTFAEAPREEAMRFGLKGRVPSNNPFVIALGEWKHLVVDFWRTSGLSRKLRVLFGPP
jgi:sterol desaturase/sphingolipid hydroxylase (fatty acid hydroxylase superfamily)